MAMTDEEREKLIKSVLPDTVNGEKRPSENVSTDLPYSEKFPQLITEDPASSEVFNLINRQTLSNDAYLKDVKADKTYVDQKVADLVNGAPEQLDTLQELSKALNNDKDFAVTVNNSIAKKLDSTANAVSATKLATARTISLTGKATGSATFDGSANASINVTAVKADSCTGNAATASAVAWSGITGKPSTYTPASHTHSYLPLSGGITTGKVNLQSADLENLPQIKRTSGAQFAGIRCENTNGYLGAIGITGTKDSAAVRVNSGGTVYTMLDSSNYNNYSPTKTGTGASGTWGINVTGSAGSVAWGNVTGKPSTYTPASHTHGLGVDNFAVTVSSTTDSWDTIGGNNKFLLKSIRTDSSYPNWLCGNYASGIAFGGSDTKGVLSVAYNTPSIKFAGGNGTKPAWWINVTGTSGNSYNLANFPTKTGTGASGTWGINVTGSSASCTGNAKTASAVAWSGVTSKPASIVKVSSWDGSTLNLTTCT